MRDRIIEVAKSWIGTPYHHQARVKGVGVDCAHLVAGIAIECGLIPEDAVLPFDYSPEWNIHNSEEKLTQYLRDFGCVEVQVAQPGDIICFHVGRAVGHLGILLPDRQYIHAQNSVKPAKVLLNNLTGKWLQRCTQSFAFPGVPI